MRRLIKASRLFEVWLYLCYQVIWTALRRLFWPFFMVTSKPPLVLPQLCCWSLLLQWCCCLVQVLVVGLTHANHWGILIWEACRYNLFCWDIQDAFEESYCAVSVFFMLSSYHRPLVKENLVSAFDGISDLKILNCMAVEVLFSLVLKKALTRTTLWNCPRPGVVLAAYPAVISLGKECTQEYR